MGISQLTLQKFKLTLFRTKTKQKTPMYHKCSLLQYIQPQKQKNYIFISQ